ncbi:Probable RNA-directed DNA polymerase from transposon BS [Eumeta japonica]|uniref:Probable RNA-directed DNA polymerase from transposon BS n=1 Tax=Eumeta variegata TaxID=151549 RepID=A0A4C1ZQY7_EUMVA|nr:Probable RNA-directed DNA polymerase from transposon BS [Eumeta japonica]
MSILQMVRSAEVSDLAAKFRKAKHVYLPPKKELLRSDLEALFALGDAVILVGDFNSKNSNWKCNYTNRNGREIEVLAESLHFDIVTPLTPTHYPNNINHRPDILDIALMKGVALKLSCIEPLQWLNSDHRPVQMSIPKDIISTDDIDNAIGALINHIRTVVDSNSRTVPAKPDRKELPRDVIELIRDKNASLRRAGKYPTCENRSRARVLQHNPPYDLEHVRRMEEEVRHTVSLPPKDDLDPITHDEISKHIKEALRLVEYISEGFKVKRKTVAVFFDVVKAFDRVWHAGLIHKLYKLELPDRLVLIIHHYISNRHFSFRLDNTYSSMRPIRAGVPQGSTLSPLLYSAYVNDIPRPSTGVQLALFADDTALYIRSNSLGNILPRLQRAIVELTQWLRLWRINVNPDKSASIYFNYSSHKV